MGLRQVLPVQTKSTCFGWDITEEHATMSAARQTAMAADGNFRVRGAVDSGIAEQMRVDIRGAVRNVRKYARLWTHPPVAASQVLVKAVLASCCVLDEPP